MVEERLSLKVLDVRLSALEDLVYAISENAVPEWRDDVLRAVIAALRQLRQQGVYVMANELEAKYFPVEGVENVGDEFVKATDLYTSGKEA